MSEEYDDSGEQEDEQPVAAVFHMEPDPSIRCICMSQIDNQGLMICCDKCELWVHAVCYKIASQNDVPEKFYCRQCQPSMTKAHTMAETLRDANAFLGYNQQPHPSGAVVLPIPPQAPAHVNSPKGQKRERDEPAVAVAAATDPTKKPAADTGSLLSEFGN